MKNKTKQLDVDFIGGQGQMTKEEEAVVSAFIKATKEKRKAHAARKARRKSIGEPKQPT